MEDRGRPPPRPAGLENMPDYARSSFARSLYDAQEGEHQGGTPHRVNSNALNQRSSSTESSDLGPRNLSNRHLQYQQQQQQVRNNSGDPPDCSDYNNPSDEPSPRTHPPPPMYYSHKHTLQEQHHSYHYQQQHHNSIPRTTGRYDQALPLPAPTTPLQRSVPPSYQQATSPRVNNNNHPSLHHNSNNRPPFHQSLPPTPSYQTDSPTPPRSYSIPSQNNPYDLQSNSNSFSNADGVHHHRALPPPPQTRIIESSVYRETPKPSSDKQPRQEEMQAVALSRLSTNSNVPAPKPREGKALTPPPPREPKMIKARLSTRYITKDVPLLATATVVKSEGEICKEEEHVSKCPSCQEHIKVFKMASLVRCPNCQHVRPNRTCTTVSFV